MKPHQTTIIVHVALSDEKLGWCIQELRKRDTEPTRENIEDFIQRLTNETITGKQIYKGNFYVYTHSYPKSMGGSIFYVGKGSNDRIRDHAREARKGTKSKKCDIIRSIWEKGEKVVANKVHEHLSDGEAVRMEKELIHKIGYENLVNVPPRTKDRTYRGEQSNLL